MTKARIEARLQAFVEQEQNAAAAAAVGAPWGVVDVSAGPDAERYPVTFGIRPPPDLLANRAGPAGANAFASTHIVLRWIPPGDFTMGSPEEEVGRKKPEIQHDVTLTNGFYIGVFEVTQKQYEYVSGTNTSVFQGSVGLPVDSMTWNDARGGQWPDGPPAPDSFCGKVTERTGCVFDLPSEAQWEYACRAGTISALNSGTNLTTAEQKDPALDLCGWYRENCDKVTQPVGNPSSWAAATQVFLPPLSLS